MSAVAPDGPRRGPVDPAHLTDAQRRRRQQIVDAAVALMLTTEYEQVQMRDVTAAAGVALGTTYRYFASKDHLMSEALLAWAAGFPEPGQGRPAGSARTTGSSRDQLEAAFALAVRAFAPHPSAYRAIAAIQASSDPYAVANFARFTTRQTARFEAFIPRVPAERRARVVQVMEAVLDVQLRGWAFGRTTLAEVRRALDDAVDLLLR